MKKFFSFDGEGYPAFHDTAAEARKAAEDALEDEQDCAADGWRDEVEAICWGEIRQHVVKTKSTPTPGGRFDSLDEYELLDIPPEDAPLALLERLVVANEESVELQEKWLEYTMRPRPLFADYDAGRQVATAERVALVDLLKTVQKAWRDGKLEYEPIKEESPLYRHITEVLVGGSE